MARCLPPPALPELVGIGSKSVQRGYVGADCTSRCTSGGSPPDLQEKACEPLCVAAVALDVDVNSVMGNIRCPLSVFSKLSVTVP